MHDRVGWLTVLLWSGMIVALHAQRRPATTPRLLQQLERDGGRVIVGLRPPGASQGMRAPGVRGLSIAQTARIAEQLRPLGFTPRRQFRVITAVSGTIAAGKLKALQSHPAVEYVQPDYLNELEDNGTHAFVEITPYGVAKLRAPEAWVVGSPPRAGEGVRVGIMDTGGDPLHEDLSYAGGYDALTGSVAPADWADTLTACGGHGTHVAGTVAARGGNDVGVVGVAPSVRLYAIKIFEVVNYGDGQCGAFTSSVLAGFDWALQNGIQVINMSFGKTSYDEAEHQAIEGAVARGVVLVAAAGNTSGAVVYPAADPDVIAVAATDEFDLQSFFSSTGPEVDVAAPGVEVYSTMPHNRYDYKSGTSMAAPHVTGLVALLVSLDPTLSVSRVRNYITGWAVDLGSPGVDEEFGFGRVDAAASVTALLGPPPPTLSITQQPDGAVWGLPLTQQPVVQLVDADSQPVARAGVTISATVWSGTTPLSPGTGPSAAQVAAKNTRSTAVQAATAVSDQTGRVEFTSLSITAIGPHVLQFSAPGHTSQNSRLVTVSLPPPIPLDNGTAVTGIDGSGGSIHHWVFTVPPEAVRLTFTSREGWGDADLYVRHHESPDFDTWDCRSWSSTAYESCSLSGDIAGEWHVVLHAYDDFSGVTLLGRWWVNQPAVALRLGREPGGAPAGQLLLPQPTVELRDALDQPVFQPGVIVSVSASRAGTLSDATPPVLTAVTDAEGRATFDGLIVTEHGTQTLTFSAPALGTATSTVRVSEPLPTIDVIWQGLVGSERVSSAVETYLDAMGNADGTFNLGDFMALLDRTDGPGSATVRKGRASGARTLP